MADSPHRVTVELLQIFAHGTYEQYLARAAELPPLSEPQRKKLRMLTIVTRAGQSKVLPYRDLMQALQIPTVRELEDLIIEAIYLKLLGGKLDQARQQFEVEFTFGRDLMDGDLDDMIAITSQWAQNIEHALKDLEVQMRDSDRTKAQGLQAARQLSNEIEIVKAKAKDEAEKLDKASGAAATAAATSGGRQRGNR